MCYIMSNKLEFHPQFSRLPATASRARELGEILYFTGKRCTKGHLSPRYASSANCAQCIADSRGHVEINHRGKSSKRSEENQARALAAFESGHLEYEATDPCPSGHYKRFVTSNNCIECAKLAMQVRAKNARWSRIFKTYGLSKDDVELMLQHQKNECAICGDDISSGYHIDHCHTTGKVRKLLCQKCNQAIGLLRENAELFDKASKYIKDHRETQGLSGKINPAVI